jgi:predicted HicB family RNase H-like nuclease
MKRTELRLPDTIYEEIRERAHQERISLNQLIITLLAAQLTAKKGEAP